MEASHTLDPFFKRNAPTATATVPRIEADMIFTTLLLNDVPPLIGTGNFGRAAVNIAANRLLAAGATPRYLSGTLTVDTDTPVDVINAIADAMKSGAVQAEAEWKNMECRFVSSGPRYGVAASIFGVGQLPPDFADGQQCVGSGDSIIVSGPVGAFGAAVAAARLGATTLIPADGEPLNDGISSLFNAVGYPHAMYFPEEGFNAAVASMRNGFPVEIDRGAVPVDEAVRAACSLTGSDPLDMRCAASMIVVVDSADESAALAALRRSAYCGRAAVVGRVI